MRQLIKFPPSVARSLAKLISMRTLRYFAGATAACTIATCGAVSSLKAPESIALAAQTRVCIVEQARCLPTFAVAVSVVANGQTILLAPGLYVKDVGILRANDVTIRVRGDGTKKAIFDPQGKIAEGKAILVVKGDRTTVDGLEFRAARAPQSFNGAGIRHEGGDLTVIRSRFIENEMGILASDHASAHVQIIDSEFARSAREDDTKTPERKYPAHNIYIGQIERLTLRGVWSYDSKTGHTLKSRARNNDIEASYFSTRKSTGSYEAEFPSGGRVRFAGNIVEQGIASENRRMFAFGLEILQYPNVGPHQVTLAHNTFVSHKPIAIPMVELWKEVPGGIQANIQNNLWIGFGQPFASGNQSAWAAGVNNFASCDFRVYVSPNAPNASAGALPAAQFEYVHPAQHRIRTDPVAGAISRHHRVFTACP